MLAPTTKDREGMAAALARAVETANGLQADLRSFADQLSEANDRFHFLDSSQNYRYARDLVDAAWRALEYAKVTLGAPPAPPEPSPR